MEPQLAIDAGRETLLFCLTLGGPLLAAALLVGIIIGVLQSVMHLQDQVISTVPKILVMALVAVLLLPWMTSQLVDFSRDLFSRPQTFSTHWDQK